MPDIPKFYLTTPIYYVNARPHIGHAYSTVAADVIARRHRLLGDDTFFLTGTDEHGQKVQRSAEAAGIPPQQFTDEVSATFQNLWKRMGITNDDYIRTTDERHKKGVQHLWRVLEERGAIYLSSYTGQYCVSDEAFVDVPVGAPCPECGRITETITEENYFFRLSDYQLPLIELIESGTLHVQPETTRNEVLSFLRGNVSHEQPTELAYSSRGIAYVPGAVKDLSISRTTFDWGIPVPTNPKHVVYVWLDALANYITAIGYGSDDPAEQAKFARYWPADLHLVGKEITRFHCVYWPAFLMAAGIPVQKSVVANGWLLFEESKMSKSRGNVVRTETILDAFGDEVYGKQFPESTKAERDLFAADVLRYFLLREIPFGQDGSFSFDALWGRYDSELSSKYGNLVQRTLNLIHTKCDGKIPELQETYKDWTAGESAFLLGQVAFNSEILQAIDRHFAEYNFAGFLNSIMNLVAWTNEILARYKPWSNESTERFERQLVLYTAAEAIRIITALLHPVMPYTTAAVWKQLGLDAAQLTTSNQQLTTVSWGGLKPGTKLGPLAPIFPRADKGLAQIMTDMESPTSPAPVPEAPALGLADSSKLTADSSTSNALPGQAPTAALQPATDNLQPATISIDDFIKIDLRVAQIVVAERIPKADKLLRLEVDLGYERRQILSGIAEFYTPEELIGKRIAIIANLAPRKMRGLESHGMLLAASGEDHSSKPILATFSDEVPLGSKIR